MAHAKHPLTNRAFDPELDAAALRMALPDYRARDLHKDRELYALFARHPAQDDPLAVYLKVIFLCRLYGINFERFAATPDGRAGIDVVIEAIVARAALFRDEIAALRALGETFEPVAINRIVLAHGRLCEALRPISRAPSRKMGRAGSRRARSAPAVFVSKYLHCHAPLVPLYDRWSVDPLAAMFGDLRNLDGSTRERPSHAGFRTMMARFWHLFHELRASDPDAAVSVKELDYYLVNRGLYLTRAMA